MTELFKLEMQKFGSVHPVLITNHFAEKQIDCSLLEPRLSTDIPPLVLYLESLIWNVRKKKLRWINH